ncbi:Dirigent protein 2 [Bienertia sinuspersici]
MDLKLLYIILPLLSLLVAPTSQHELHHQHQHQHHSGGHRSAHFTLYLQETLNKTAYFIVKGVAGPGGMTVTANPFGSLFVYNDPLTETPDPNSKVMGHMEGTDVTSSFRGERAMCNIRTTLNLKGYKGELLNVGVGYFNQVSEYPLVGGTGDFRFAQGYMTSSAVKLTGPTTCYKIDFVLFWPPYAAPAH